MRPPAGGAALMGDRDGGGSRGRIPVEQWYPKSTTGPSPRDGDPRPTVSNFDSPPPLWNPADHATYCPQHNEPPEDGGGSSWLCCCSGPLAELRTAARAVIDAEYGSNTWAEAFDVLVDVVLGQERLEAADEDDQ